MKISIVGCGNMGQAYARSFRKYGLVQQDDLLLVLRSEVRRHQLEPLGKVALSMDEAIGTCDLVIVAVKPQDFGTIAGTLAPVLRPGQVVLSIMAGITIARLQAELRHQTVVRAMPNSPAQIGMGITAYATGTELSMRQTLMVEQLLNSTGRAVHLEHEAHLDPVTALSGSGPAYFFYLMELLTDFGIKQKIPARIAAELAMQTGLGAALLAKAAKVSCGELRQMVTSKKGTTEAALKTIMKKKFGKIFQAGLAAAAHRSRELRGR